jgi:hypothetical protein
MNNYVVIAGALTVFLSSAAMAQHSGTDQEQRACASNVQRYCRPVLDQGDFAVLAASSNIGKNSQRLAKRFLPITASDRRIPGNCRRAERSCVLPVYPARHISQDRPDLVHAPPSAINEFSESC